MDRGYFPDDTVIDNVIIVPQHIPNAGNLRPRDVGITRFDLFRQMARCFRDDFDASLERSRHVIDGAEGFEVDTPNGQSMARRMSFSRDRTDHCIAKNLDG
ncbi:MAG TPA: hypothetical protein VEM36_04170 [Xanthobacteraceae bacterium]|nr:hypothetical protein [Xanthobacteraceae bacterium]